MTAPAPRPPDAAPVPPEASGPEGGVWHRRALASLSIPNYRWFLFGQGTSVVGLWMRSAAQSWLVYELTGSEVLLGIVAALSQGALGVMSPLGGAVADRVDKRLLLMRLGFLSGGLSLALGALVLSGRVEVWHVALLAALSGAVKGFEIPTRQSFVVEMVGREHLPNAIALNTAMFNTARVIGPAVAGWLFDALDQGIAICFLADGVSYLAIVGSLTRIRPLPREVHREGGGWRSQLRAGFDYARGNLRVRTLLTLLSIFLAFGWSFLSILPAFTRDVLGLSGRGYGMLMAMNGAGALMAAIHVAATPPPADRRRLRRIVFGSIALSAAALVAFALVTHPWAAGAALVVQGYGAISFLSRGNALVQLAVPDHLRGRVMSLWVLVFILSLAVGGLFVGALAEQVGRATGKVGSPLAMAACGVLCLVLSAVVFLRLPPIERESTAEV